MLLKRALALLLLAAAFPYFRAPVYEFPPSRPFSGAAWYNPYAQSKGAWLMANLHAHGRAWLGLTNGQQTDDEVARAYRAVGYDVAVISDYQSIAAHVGEHTMPAYEHGYNIGKTHQLVLGARRVEWIEFPFFQWRSQKQYVINRLTQSAEFVALVHPNGRDAYTMTDMASLTGYQGIEVLNGAFAAEDRWDAALSAGRLVWGMADDDTHDITDPKRMAVAWNMVDAASPGDRDVLSALAEGRSYAVGDVSGRDNHRGDVLVQRVGVDDGTLSVSWTGTPGTLSFVRQNGQVRKTVEHVTAGSYALAPDDQYVRAVVRTAGTVVYLNPVIRCEGTRFPAPVATVNGLATWLLRIPLAIGCAAIMLLLWRRTR